MTQSDLEQELLQLPPHDKLRIIELLIKSLSSLWPRASETTFLVEPSQSNPANTPSSWPELINSLAGGWSDFPSMVELRAEDGVDIPREGF